jgi:hypothetical protein
MFKKSLDEHNDDLEPEVIEGEEIETETYDDADDEEGSELGSDATAASGGDALDQDESDDEARDTI